MRKCRSTSPCSNQCHTLSNSLTTSHYRSRSKFSSYGKSPNSVIVSERDRTWDCLSATVAPTGWCTGVCRQPSLFLFENSYLICLFAYRNKDKVARSVKIIKPDSKLFEVVPNKKFKNFRWINQPVIYILWNFNLIQIFIPSTNFKYNSSGHSNFITQKANFITQKG